LWVTLSTNELAAQPEWQWTLVICLFHSFKSELSKIILPRLCQIAFTFAQPFLITAALELLYQTDDTKSWQKGYELIAATLFVYSGKAVSTPMDHLPWQLTRYSYYDFTCQSFPFPFHNHVSRCYCFLDISKEPST
jgi:hypothetical protein